MYTCKIDNQEFDSLKKLHSHISRRLKIKIEDYYTKYYPRFDLLTNELIDFKNREFYFYTLFNSRDNLVNYLKINRNDIETLFKVVSEVIKLRKLVKDLTFAPSTVEARTSILPTPYAVESSELNYNKICKSLGLITRYSYSEELSYNTKPLDFIVDTREQRPFIFPNANTTVSKLDFGDYTSTSHYQGVYFERKNLMDLCGTLSKGYERFQEELTRAKALDAYIVVAVEAKLETVCHLEDTEVSKRSKVTSEFITHRIRELCEKFDNIQFIFAPNATILAQLVEKISLLNNNIRQLDLQFYIDTRKLSV